MKTLVTVLGILIIATTVMAEKPILDNPTVLRVPCDLVVVTHDWDFALGDQGFTLVACDATGGGPAWEYGATTYVAGAPGNVWGTVLEGDYVEDSGEGLVSPIFTVGSDSYLMEVHHYFDCENLWDGGNVTVNGNVITPVSGYPGLINVPTSYYAWCVDNEEGFTGVSGGWVTSCFDLSAYDGQDIQVVFEFGSDASFVEAGWYLGSVKVGGLDAVPTQESSWSQIKSQYR